MSTKREFIKLKNLTLLTQLQIFGEIFHMNKKIAAIIAGSVAALGSAFVAAPAQAQVTMPVTVEVQPQIYLSTYKDLNFVITQKDIAGVLPDQSVSYDEKTGVVPPKMVRPTSGSAPSAITRDIEPLYYVWATNGTQVNVIVEAKEETLSRVGSTDPEDTVTMSVLTPNPTSITGAGLANSAARPGSVKLGFEFQNGTAGLSAGKYEGGQLGITVSTP